MTESRNLLGVDISSNNGRIDLMELATSRQFVIIKASGDEPGERGENTYVNPFFAVQWPQAKAARLERGTYHYARFQHQKAAASADHFLQTIEDFLDDGVNLMLDLEEGDGNLLNDAMEWLTRVQDATDVAPYLYSNQSFIEEHGLNHPELAINYRLWLASWGPTYRVVPPWSRVYLWQNSATDQTVPGFDGKNALTDVFFGTRSDWRQQGYGQGTIESYESLYWTPIQNLVNDMVSDSYYPHADAAFHATISNAITLHKIAVGAESPMA